MNTNTPRTISADHLFPLGCLYMSRGAQILLTHEQTHAALDRHARGDWGDIDPADQDANRRALEDGSRLLSVYHTAGGARFFVITEADRDATTVLLPEEY